MAAGCALRVGDVFEHPRMLDADWRPPPGGKYADGPHAVCRITRVASGRVWYRILGQDGQWRGRFSVQASALARVVPRAAR